MAAKTTGKVKSKGAKTTDPPNPKGVRTLVLRVPGGKTLEWR